MENYLTSIYASKYIIKKYLFLFFAIFFVMVILIPIKTYASFLYYKPMTLSEAQSGTADSTDWVLTISLDGNVQAADADLKTVGNAGFVQNANGYDIRPHSNATCTSALTYELVFYEASTGKLEMHVKIPTLSTSVDTVIYLCFGDSSISTDGSSNTTWDTNHKGVYHFSDGSSLSVADSSQSASNGSNTGVAAIAGEIDGAADFGGGADVVNVNTFSDFGRPITFEFWEKHASMLDSDQEVIAAPAAGFGFLLYHHSSTVETGFVKALTFFSDVGEVGVAFSPDGNWHHFGISIDAAGAATIVKDGVSASVLTITPGASHPITGTAIQIGNGAGLPLVGQLDEFKISSTNRSVSWLIADFNNQKASSNFITWGSKVSTSEVTPRILRLRNVRLKNVRLR